MLRSTINTMTAIALGTATSFGPAFATEEHKSSGANLSHKFPPQVPAVVAYDYDLNVRITQQNRKLTPEEWKALLDRIVEDALKDIIAKAE